MVTTPAVWSNQLDLNGLEAGAQTRLSIAGLSNGGFIAVWADFAANSDGSGSGLFAQRFDAFGKPVGGQITINSTTAGNQDFPDVVGLPGGGFFTVWEDASGASREIRGRFFKANGDPVANDFVINTTTANDQTDPSAAVLSSGDIVVTWTDGSLSGGDTSGTAIRAKVIDKTGGTVIPEFLVNDTTTSSQTEPAVAALDNGGFAITWTDTSSGTQDVRIKFYDSSGVSQFGELPVAFSGDEEFDPAIANLVGAGLVVVWTETDGGTDNNIHGRVYATDEGNSFSTFTINATTASSQADASVVGLLDGGFIVLWTDSSQTAPDTSAAAIRAQRFTSDGVRIGKEFVVNTTKTGAQLTGDVALLADGRIIAGWGDESSGLADVKGKILDPRGTNVIGTEKADLLVGSTLDNAIDGDAGNDVLFGQQGDDLLEGRSGNDTLDGGSGDDVIRGGSGDDVVMVSVGADEISGGSGTDTLNLTPLGSKGVILKLASGKFDYPNSSNVQTIKSIENVTGTAAKDDIAGNSANNRLLGGDGNDKLDGAAGNDLLRGQLGNDTLIGGAGNDTLEGTGGNDTLRGGSGKDMMTGGAGADVFDFDTVGDSSAGADRDVINDFNASQGDKIDFNGIDANTTVAGNQDFTFIATGFTGVAGQLRFQVTGGVDGIIRGDVDGDSVADFSILVKGVTSMVATDFIL